MLLLQSCFPQHQNLQSIMAQTLEEKYQALEEQFKLMKQENDALHKKLKQSTNTTNNDNTTNDSINKEKRATWDLIYDVYTFVSCFMCLRFISFRVLFGYNFTQKLISDPNGIKAIMKRKIIDINEKSPSGSTLLMMCAGIIYLSFII